MKKLLAITLILVLCLSVVLVACDKDSDEQPAASAPASELSAARDALEKLAAIKKESTADFYVTKSTPVKGIYAFPTSWAVDNDKIKLVDAGTKIKVDVPERYTGEAFEYTLTATLTADDGTTATVEFKCTVPHFEVVSFEDYKKACEAKDKEKTYNVVGYVVGVNADSDSSSVGSMWVMDKDGHGYYAYAPTGISGTREAINAAYPFGTEVVVNGTLTVYNGCYEFNKGCTITKTGNTAQQDGVTLNYVDRTTQFANSTDSKHAHLVDYQATLAKLDGIRMGAIDGLNLRFTLNGVDYVCYNNVYLMDETTMEQFKAKWVPGGKANIRGIVNVFGGVYQIYPNSLDCLEIVPETDQEKVEGFKQVLSLEDKYSRNFTLPSSTYVNVAWTVTGEGATIGADGYSVTLSQLDDQSQEVTFTATITSGEASVEYTKTVTISKKLAAFENKVEGADIKSYSDLKKAAPTTKGDVTSEKYYTMGYISKIDNADYGNVYIVDENGNEFYVYGLYSYDGKVRYDKMDASVKPQVDDLVVVYGVLSFYNSAQMKSAWLLQLNDKVLLPTDAEIVDMDAAAIESAGLETSYFEDFILTLTGANGSTIEWKCDNEKVTIDKTTGKVSFADLEADATVTFTGTVTKGSSTKDVTLTTKLIASNTEYTVNYSAGENGAITSVKNGDVDVATGSKVKVGTVLKVTVAPDANYRLASYTIGDKTDKSVVGATEFELTITADTTFSVAFELTSTEVKSLTIKKDGLKILDNAQSSTYDKYKGNQTIGDYNVNIVGVMPNTYNTYDVVQLKAGDGTIKVTGTFSKIKIVYVGANTYSDAYGFNITVGGAKQAIDASVVNATKVETGITGSGNQDKGKAIYQFTVELSFASTTGEIMINNIKGAKYCTLIELS